MHGLHVVANKPKTIKTLQKAVKTEKPTISDHSVEFEPADFFIATSSPTMIVGIGHGEHDSSLLAEELDSWVSGFNAVHGAREFLHVIEGQGTVGRVLGRHAYAIPSCVGHALHLTAQDVYFEERWELAFDVNENRLTPERALAEVRDAQATGAAADLHGLRGEVRSTQQGLKGVRDLWRRGVSEMGRQTINLQTFGRDLSRNLLH